MPITLPPVSRRRFLGSVVGAGVGLALGQRLGWGEDRPAGRDVDRVALLSDTHVAADPARLARGVNMSENLGRVVGEVVEAGKRPGGPSMAIVNGDCAYSVGGTGDYEQMLALLRPLREAGLPVHLGMGNHDHRERFWAAVPAEMGGGVGADRPVESRQVLVLETPRADWVVLDSLDQTNSTPGVIGAGQLKWLAGMLDEPRRKGKAVLLMVHHHPQFVEELVAAAGAAATRPVKNNGITDTEALMEVVRPRRNVKALIFGHTHVWGHREREGLHLINLPATAYVFREEQPAGWVDCHVREGGARFALNAIDRSHPKHGEVLDLEWRT